MTEPVPSSNPGAPPSTGVGSALPRRSFLVRWLLHGLAMAALGGLIGFQLWVEYDRAESMERERLINHARMIGKNLSQELDATYQALLGVRAEPGHWAQAAGSGQASQRLKTLVDAMPGVRTITVLNAEGVVTTSNRADLVGSNFGKRPYFETARRLADPNLLVVSPPFRTSLGVFAINLVMMIPGPKGEFAGVVSTTLDPDYFKTLLGSVLYAPDMWSALAHGDGLQFLMVPERPDQSGKNLAQPGSFFTRHQESGQPETLLTGAAYSTGEERMMAQITIKPPGVPMDRPLIATVGRESGAIHAEWRQDAEKQAALYLLLLFGSSAGLFYHHRRQLAFDRRVAETNRALEEARHQAEAASSAKSAFLATMSHEIRTPITSVLGMTDLLRHTTLSEEQAGYVDTLASSTRALLTILNDILDISKIEAGKITLESAAFPLHEAAREVVALNLAVARAKGLTLGLEIGPGVPAMVVGDSARLKQVLHNLIGNAIKFTGDGSVLLRLSAAVAGDGGAALVRAEIEDTGIGIADAEVDRLFKAFSQVDPSTTRRFGGTGLGLAISRRLVGLMGGEIGVVSRPGQGSRFWFTVSLPLAEAGQPAVAVGAAAPAPAAPVAPPPAKRLRILVAEDNRVNRMLVRAMLIKLGHVVEVAENGRLALAAVAVGAFDIVLMDMQMPEMDGEEATRAIRALPSPRDRTPVLALTADVMAEHRERYLRAGVNDLVPKPIDWQVLAEALEAHTA